jgi:hypothetical protein
MYDHRCSEWHGWRGFFIAGAGAGRHDVARSAGFSILYRITQMDKMRFYSFVGTPAAFPLPAFFHRRTFLSSVPSIAFVINLLPAAVILYSFARLLEVLGHGTPRRSKRLMLLLGLCASPVFLYSIVYSGRVLVVTAILLAILRWIFRHWEQPLRPGDHLKLGGATAGSVLLLGIMPEGFAGLFPALPSYSWDDILYLFSPLMHPWFLLPLPLIFWLFRRTDVYRAPQRVLLLLVIGTSLLAAGIEPRTHQALLPAFCCLLLLLFPTWDRFISYGFYFAKEKWMYPILGGLLLLQIAFAATLFYLG